MGDAGDKGERVCQQGGFRQPVGRRMGRRTLGLWIGKKE